MPEASASAHSERPPLRADGRATKSALRTDWTQAPPLMLRSDPDLAARCVSCTHLNSGFCAALFNACGEQSALPRLHQQFFTVRAGQQIKCQSEARDDVLVLCTGWAFRYIQLSDGGRQILRFLLPGDIFSPAAIFAKGMSFSAKALTQVQVSRLDGEEVRKQCRADELVMMEVFRSLGDNGRASYELITVLGQRPAERRIAHLLLSLMRRVAAHSVMQNHRYPFPLKQQHIADAVGLTSVHVSRVLALFRDRKILTISEGTLEVTDLAELERLAALN